MLARTGCASQRTLANAEIVPLAVLDIGVDIRLCENGEVLNLLDDVPTAYVNELGINYFMGNGILENNFYPEIAKTGIHEIKYLLRDTVKDEDVNVCYTSGSRMIEVINILSNDEDVSFIGGDDIKHCQGDGTLDLNTFISLSDSIKEGTWSIDQNSSILGGLLDPLNFSVGVHTINYSNSSTTSGCNVVFDFSVTIKETPNPVSIIGESLVCFGDEINLSVEENIDTKYIWYSGEDSVGTGKYVFCCS